MKKFLGFICLLFLVGCNSGTGGSSYPLGPLTLSLKAPREYPAGIAFTAYITVNNTSSTNGSNLIYSVEKNYTGQDIVINPNGAGQNCTNVAAGSNCVLTATIPAGTISGSFTIVAKPSDEGQARTKERFLTTITLVDIPSSDTQFYILPDNQLINDVSMGEATAYVSVLVKPSAHLFNNLALVDESGNVLDYHLLNTSLDTASNGVNTYRVTMPASKSLQAMQVLSSYNDVTTCTNNCSNLATVSITNNYVGILTISPNNFTLSDGHESQIISFINNGNNIINILNILPPAESGFYYVNDYGCFGTLYAGQSCQVVIGYTGIESGNIRTEVTYNNGESDMASFVDIHYIGTPAGILTISPKSLTLNAESPVQSFTLMNTGNRELSLTDFPVLNNPLTQVNTSCQLNSPLAINESCTYTVGYLASENNGRQIISFIYNNSNFARTTQATVNWEN